MLFKVLIGSGCVLCNFLIGPTLNLLDFRSFQKFVSQGYPSGGAGYVISRAGLKLIAEGLLKEVKHCTKGGGAEDVNLGRHFKPSLPHFMPLCIMINC